MKAPKKMESKTTGQRAKDRDTTNERRQSHGDGGPEDGGGSNRSNDFDIIRLGEIMAVLNDEKVAANPKDDGRGQELHQPQQGLNDATGPPRHGGVVNESSIAARLNKMMEDIKKDAARIG